MSISTGLDWTGNLAENADKSAASVDRLVQSLRALQSQGAGPTSAGLGGNAGGIAAVGAAAKEANKAVAAQAKSAAELAKIEAKRIADLDVIAAKEKAAAASVAGQAEIINQRTAQAQATESAKAAAKVATIQAQSDADRNRAIGRVVEGQAKAANDIAVAQAKGAEAAARAAEKAAHIERQGAIDSAHIREKSAADLARIEAKKQADMARDAHRASLRGASATRTKSAVQTIAQGGSGFDVADAVGGKAGAAIAVGTVAVGVAAKLASLASEYTAATIGAQNFKEDITEAFKTVRGTNEAASSTFETAIKNADALRIKRADSIATFLDLATKGFNDTKIKEIQGRLLDLTTIDPRASVEGLTKVIGKAAAQGRLNVDILSELSTFGLEQSDVIAEIGKLLKVDDKEVLRRLSSAGGIRDLGVDPILNAIARQTGGGAAGAKAAEKADRNLSSLITRLEDIPSNLLFDVSVGPGIDSIKGIIRDVLAFFDASSSTGQRTRKVLGDIFNAITEPLFGKRAGDQEGITGTLNQILSVSERAVPVIREVSGSIGTFARAMLALGSGDTSKLDESTKRIVGIVNLIKELGLLSAPGGTFGPGGLIQPILDIIGIDADASEVRKWVDAVAGLLNPVNIFRTIKDVAMGGDGTLGNPILQAIQSAVDGAVSWVFTGASSIGSFFVDGLANGITSKASAVVAAVKSVAGSALSTAASVLRIGSPSKETTQYGEWYSEGMGIGIENRADYVSRAARLMAEDALVAGSMSVPQLGPPQMATSRNSGASAGQRQLPPITININIANAGSDSELSKESLKDKYRPAFRELAIELLVQIAQEA